MNKEQPPRAWSWRRSRYGLATFHLASLLTVWFVLRLVLLLAYGPRTASVGEDARVFLLGFQRDLFTGLLLALPMLGWLWVVAERRQGTRWHRRLFWSVLFLFWLVQVFVLFAEFYFFQEFQSRFNTVAVDYLLFPDEVFVNIWESYPVGVVVAVCLALAAGWTWGAARLFPQAWETPCPAKIRGLALAVALALTGGLWLSFDPKRPPAAADRTLSEIANNGDIAFVAAFLTRNLDYRAFYKTIDRAEAYQRVRRMLSQPNAQFGDDQQSIHRKIAGDSSRPRLNVVLILEESLGSEFWGCLGRKETLTPEMDKLANEEGWLFTNLYASGNRTVRGFEGVLSSFPPLPGDSIVRRDLSDHVETIARVFKRDGYETLFLYGGRGLFDGMRSFAVRNGYDRFIEQKYFEHPTFTTVWGVCDEDLFDRTITELQELSKGDKPFLATVLSVSNHKPFTYPRGRIPEDPDKHQRDYAVKYSDYALGRFFRAAKGQSFWTNTLFAVVADHGARVYGQQSIPIHSYEIPLVILGPAVVSNPRRIGQLGGSLDVAPTILGLIGRPYESTFFGRDLLNTRPQDGRAFLNHNRDIGMLAQDRLVVLGLKETVQFYQGDPKTVEMSLLREPAPPDRELEEEALAVFQVADELYTKQRYRVE